MIICLKGILEKYFSLNANVNDSPKFLRDLGRLLEGTQALGHQGTRKNSKGTRALKVLRHLGTPILEDLGTRTLGHFIQQTQELDSSISEALNQLKISKKQPNESAICNLLSEKLEVIAIIKLQVIKKLKYLFFNIVFLSRTFTIHRITWEEGHYFLNSFLPLHTSSQTLKFIGISRVIAAESSPLHIASSRIRTGDIWFPIATH